MKHLQTVEDYISDEYFQYWVLEKDSDAEVYWNQWKARYPEAIPIMEEASQLILSLNFKADFPEDGRSQTVWNRIQAQKGTTVTNSSQKKKGSKSGIQWKVAAIITLLLTTGYTFWSIWKRDPATISHATNFGQTQQLTLPDSSSVLLNANSTIRYLASWEEIREVWLQGEAFFQVSRQYMQNDTLHPVKFLVHTEQLDIEVVGTAFNVNTRRAKTQVVLNHGRVNLKFKNRNNTENLVMKPGEMVEFTAQDFKIIREEVDTVLYTAWVNKKLIFEDQPLQGIANVLADNFGYEIIFTDTAILSERFTASIPINDVELLFPMLARAFDLDMKRSHQKIIFSSK